MRKNCICGQYYYLTELLVQMIEEDSRLRTELRNATARYDAERITSLQKAIMETETEILFNRERMNEHLQHDHPHDRPLMVVLG